MASQNLANLQATVNRFASDADFSPLVIDGGMGSKTIAAVSKALSYAAGARAADQVNTAAGQQGQANAVLFDQQIRTGDPATFIMQTLSSINSALADVADALGMTEAAVVVLVKPQAVIPSTVPDKTAFKVKAPASMNPFDATRLWLRQLSTVGQVGVGAGALVVLLAGFSAIKKKKAAGPAGYRGW